MQQITGCTGLELPRGFGGYQHNKCLNGSIEPKLVVGAVCSVQLGRGGGPPAPLSARRLRNVHWTERLVEAFGQGHAFG